MPPFVLPCLASPGQLRTRPVAVQLARRMTERSEYASAASPIAVWERAVGKVFPANSVREHQSNVILLRLSERSQQEHHCQLLVSWRDGEKTSDQSHFADYISLFPNVVDWRVEQPSDGLAHSLRYHAAVLTEETMENSTYCGIYLFYVLSLLLLSEYPLCCQGNWM